MIKEGIYIYMKRCIERIQGLPFFFCSILLASVLAVPSIAFLQSTPAVPVATVNIQNVQLLSQNDRTFRISFSLSNREGLQSGVKYGVRLMSMSPKGQFVADEKVYEEPLTLYEHTSVQREITYTVPPQLGGDFSLFLTSQNEQAFPFGITFITKTTLTPSVKGIEVDPQSCFLSLEGEKATAHHALLEGVTVRPSQKMTLTCSGRNTSTGSHTLTPTFETKYRSAYGKEVAIEGGVFSAISFAPGDQKTFSFPIPTATAPELYEATVTLLGDDSSSNTIVLHYNVNGVRASIEMLSLDKDRYESGDVAKLSLVWLGEEALLSTQMKDGNGTTCGLLTNNSLKRETTTSQTIVSLPISVQCIDPTVSLTLTDTKGTLLDEKTFSFQTKQGGSDNEGRLLFGMGGAVAVVALLVLAARLKRKELLSRDHTI